MSIVARFSAAHPDMSIGILSVPHFVSLSRREADMAITLERPERGRYVFTRLCDYALRPHGTRDYLDRYDPVRSVADLRHHRFVDYVADLAFSHALLYLNRTVPNVTSRRCSTSVIAQYHATLQGQALAILPCFMAATKPALIPILPDEVVVTRHFWISCREDLHKLRRMTVLWNCLREAAEANRSLLMGETVAMRYVTA